MADSKAIAQAIRDGRTSLGIEFGSTRIKAVLIDDERNTITTGDYGWQSHLVDGLWSYDVDKIWRGLQSVYADVADRVEADYGLKLHAHRPDWLLRDDAWVSRFRCGW